VLEAAAFVGKGHRKVWARLRYRGVRTSKARALRLMRDARLLAPTRLGHAYGPAAHDGTVLTARPDVMWGTDATPCLSRREGTATIFIAIDHCTAECVGTHAANPGTRFEAPEPIRQGVRATFGGYAAGVAAGLALRHDQGSQSMSDHSAAAHQPHLRSRGTRAPNARWRAAVVTFGAPAAAGPTSSGVPRGTDTPDEGGAAGVQPVAGGHGPS
jgi:hypothetical protein